MADKELPGFYRDPKTGRYFRDNPDDTGNSTLKRIKVDGKENLAKFKKPQTTNLFNYLKAREIRAIGGVQEAREYYRMRLSPKLQVHETDLSHQISAESESIEIKNVEFLKGCDTSVYGIWSGIHRNVKKVVFGKIDCTDTQERNFYCKSVLGYVTDMCPGPLRTHIVLYNSPSCKVPFADFFPKMSFHSTPEYESLYESEFFRPVAHTFLDMHLFCCASSKDLTKIAFGSENMLFFYNAPYGGATPIVDGQVHCISFEESNNLMAYGLHNGLLMLVDRRTDIQKVSRRIKVSNQTLTDCAFFTSDKLLVAGANDKMIMVDLRKEEVKRTEENHVATFVGHKQSIKKQSFSFIDDLLCARGCDNVVRIWNINGGAPIRELYPSVNPQNKVHGLLTKVDGKTKLCYFEGSKKKMLSL